MSLKNLSIAAAATLIYEETQECTFYLDHKDLKRVVAGLGGIGTDSITGKTNLVVLGDTSRERNKKGEDKWVTSGRCKQIEKQREQHDAGQRKLPFKVNFFVLARRFPWSRTSLVGLPCLLANMISEL